MTYRISERLLEHVPVLLHSHGIVCRCQEVLADAEEWAEHAASKIKSTRELKRPRTEAEWDEWQRNRDVPAKTVSPGERPPASGDKAS